MPVERRLTNPGKPLHSTFKGGESDTIREIPPEWRAAMNLLVVETPMPWDVDIPDLSDEILAAKAEQTFTSERKQRITSKPTGVFTLLESYTDRHKLLGQRTRDFRFEDDYPASVPSPSALRDVETRNFGNKHFELKVEELPDLWVGQRYNTERPVVTPEDFRARLKTYNVEGTELGLALFPPPLFAGQIAHGDEQETVYTHRESLKYTDLNDLPAIIPNRRTNRFKQVETVTRILDVDSMFQFDPTATRDIEFTYLGDGTAVQVLTDVDEVFDQYSASREIADLVPEIFKAVLPVTNNELVIEGTVADLTLNAGEFFKSYARETEDTIRLHTRSRDPTPLGPILVSDKLGGIEFGGGRIKTWAELTNAFSEPVEGLLYTDSSVTNLGNGLWVIGYSLLDEVAWPELIGTEVDPRTGIVVGITKQVVPAGTTGGVDVDGYHDVKPLDKWRSISISSKLDFDSLPFPRVWETTVEHRFPNTLLGLEWVWAAAAAPFAYDFDMALVLDMQEGYTGPCRGKVTETFSLGPPSDVVTPTIFCPQAHTLGFAWSYAADPSDDCGTCIGIARAHAQTWAIPPSLHDAISIGGAVTLDHGSFTSTLPATSPISLPTPGSLITKACEVEVWRFGVFYRRLTEIFVPDCGV